MREPKPIYCANDNRPLRGSLQRRSLKLVATEPEREAPSPIIVHKRRIAALWLVPVLSILAGIYAIWQSTPLNILFWPSLGFGAVLFSITIWAEQNSALKNVSGLAMIAAFAVSINSWLAQAGFSLVNMELALLIAGLALVTGWMFKSIPAVLLSSFSTLVYLASLYPELGLMTGISDQISQLGSGILPIVILAQIILSERLRSSFVLFFGIISAYIWIGTLTTDMPLKILAGLGFAIAAAHYWLGKARLEADKFGGRIHQICGWLIAFVAVIYVQIAWLSMDPGQAKPVWTPNTFWWAAFTTAAATLFITSLMRYKSSHISLVGIFIISFAVVAIPLATAKPELTFLVFDKIPGLDARPGLGLMMGAVILASGLIWLVSGLMNGRKIDASMGTIVIGTEAFILFQPENYNTDLGVIFVLSLICALCFGGLIAGASSDLTQPREHSA